MPANVSHENILLRPLLSEKSTFAMNDQQRYTFAVDPRATKTEIKAAVEAIYKVKVAGINTTIRQSAQRATKFGLGGQKISKKALVRLRDGDKIELF
jgi:large subunit ribosomal protein L23